MQEHHYFVDIEATPEELWKLFWFRAPRSQSGDVTIEILHPGDATGEGLVRHCTFRVPRYLLSGGKGQSWEWLTEVIPTESWKYNAIGRPLWSTAEGRTRLEDLGDGTTRVHFSETYHAFNPMMRALFEKRVHKFISKDNDTLIKSSLTNGITQLRAREGQEGTARLNSVSSPVEQLTHYLAPLLRAREHPLLVALDGRSGVGKSTLAGEVAARLGGSVIDGDDFYVGGTSEYWDGLSTIERARQVIDWRRQSLVLETLARGGTASWLPYDWEADNGSLANHPLTCSFSTLVILEGAYSARPDLADLFDVRVLLQADAFVRRTRLNQRDGVPYQEDWRGRWLASEDYYFGTVMPPEAFDLVLESADRPS